MPKLDGDINHFHRGEANIGDFIWLGPDWLHPDSDENLLIQLPKIPGPIWIRCKITADRHGGNDEHGPYHWWNGDYDKPTVRASILVTFNDMQWHGYLTDGVLSELS